MEYLSYRVTGNFKADENVIGLTDLCEYFPFYIQDNPFIAEHVFQSVYLYNKPERNREGWGINRYTELFHALKYSLMTRDYKFIVEGVEHDLVVMQGYIADTSGKILLLLAKNNMNANTHDEILLDKVRLYVSNEFMINPLYKLIYKKVQKDYIDQFIKEGAEVVYSTSKKIEESCFKDGFNIEYQNLTQLTEILSTEPRSILNFSEDAARHEIWDRASRRREERARQRREAMEAQIQSIAAVPEEQTMTEYVVGRDLSPITEISQELIDAIGRYQVASDYSTQYLASDPISPSSVSTSEDEPLPF